MEDKEMILMRTLQISVDVLVEKLELSESERDKLIIDSKLMAEKEFEGFNI